MERNHNSDKITRDKLVLLVGPSGSGKTTIAKELEKEGYNIIHSYTTRKPRTENEWGHIFITEEEFYEHSKLTDERFVMAYNGSKMIAFFNGYDKDKCYFATEQQYQGKGTSVYVVDPSGAKEIQERVKDAEVITIFLMCDGINRYWRLAEREGLKPLLVDTREDEIKRIEIDKKVEKDKEIFKSCKCDYVIDTKRPLEEVLELVREVIGDSDV